MSTATNTDPATVQILAELDSMGIKTVRGLINYALDRGIKPSELLAETAARNS